MFRHAVLPLIKDVLITPLWWYAGGLFWFIQYLSVAVLTASRQLNIFLWLRHLFTPMYQQYDWQGRIVSFLVRVFQIVSRTVFFLAHVFFFAFLFLAWIVGPVALFYFTLTQIPP